MGDNDVFVTKKPIYQSSSVFLTKDEIGQKVAWNLNEITSHKSLHIDIGMKIFTI
jgi:hypothetical protein